MAPTGWGDSTYAETAWERSRSAATRWSVFGGLLGLLIAVVAFAPAEWLARAVGSLKVGQAYRPEREAQVLRRIKERNPGPLAGETVALLFREIMSACLALERPITVAYLGPRGTFSERATLKHFGLAAEAMPVASIDEVFRSVESRAADFGIGTEGASFSVGMRF